MFIVIFGQGISQILVSINIMIKELKNLIGFGFYTEKNPKLSFSTVSFKTYKHRAIKSDVSTEDRMRYHCRQHCICC